MRRMQRLTKEFTNTENDRRMQELLMRYFLMQQIFHFNVTADNFTNTVSAVISPPILAKLSAVIPRLPTKSILVSLIKSPFLAVKF